MREIALPATGQDPSEAQGSMNRRRSSLPTAVLPIVAVLALCSPAAAAEGELSIFPDGVHLAILIVAFLGLVFPVNALLVRPLLRTLEERAQRIEGARDRAAELSRQADESLARHRSAIEAARGEAERERRAALEAARREQTRLTQQARAAAEQEIERARAGIRAILAEVRDQLRRDSELLARQAVARILGRPVS
jgi:F-type H+-transporting ATPase subunit b